MFVKCETIRVYSYFKIKSEKKGVSCSAQVPRSEFGIWMKHRVAFKDSMRNYRNQIIFRIVEIFITERWNF